MHMSLDMPSCADLFAFEPSEGAGLRSLTIRRIVPLTPVGEIDLLHLVSRIKWPSDSPMAVTIAAALREHGITPPPPEAPGRNGNGHWHPIPGQGIDGRIDDFDVLLGTEQFIEDAGITIAEPARSVLAEHDRNRWASVLIAAFHRVGASKEIHRSLLGILAVGQGSAEVPPPDSPASSTNTGQAPTTKPIDATTEAATPTDNSPGCTKADEPAERTAPPATALTSEEQAALTQAVASMATPAALLAPGPAQPTRLSPIAARFRLKSKRARQIALLACLACLSSIAGTVSSCLSVSANEAVAVQRFGRVVAVCGSGLHFRPLWPIETLTRLQPALIRQVRFGSPVTENKPPSGIASERVSSLFLTSDAALRVSGRIEYAVGDVEAYAFGVEDPDRLIAATADAALVEILAGHSALWVLGPERGLLTAQLMETVRQRLTALGSGIRIHGLMLDGLALPSGTNAINVDAAFRGVTMAESDRAAALRKAQVENERTVAEAKARASNLVDAAEAERSRTVETARTLAQRVQAHLEAFRDNPVQVREQLIFNLLLKDSSGRPKILVDPALSNKVQFMVGNTEPVDSAPLPRPESQPAAASQPAGGKP